MVATRRGPIISVSVLFIVAGCSSGNGGIPECTSCDVVLEPLVTLEAGGAGLEFMHDTRIAINARGMVAAAPLAGVGAVALYSSTGAAPLRHSRFDGQNPRRIL
jgi:hypothetical protein